MEQRRSFVSSSHHNHTIRSNRTKPQQQMLVQLNSRRFRSNFELINCKCVCDDHYSPSLQTCPMRNILCDKDDYPQIEKRQSNLVKITINRVGERQNDDEEINDKLKSDAICRLNRGMSFSAIRNQKSFSSRFCGRIFNRSASAYTSKKSDRMSTDAQNVLNIYARLSDWQAACRRPTTKYRKQNQSGRLSAHDCSHYRPEKRKLPVCYRYFPFSLNALLRCNTIQQQYIDRCHLQSMNHQTKVSVDIRKVLCRSTDSNEDVHHSLISFDTDSIDGSDESRLRWKQENPKIDEDEQESDASESVEIDDVSNVESIAKQFSNVSAHILTEDDDYDTRINLATSLINKSVPYLLYQTPSSQAIRGFYLTPACFLTLILCGTRTSIMQIPGVSSIIPESDVTHFWQYRSTLNYSINDVQDDQKVVLDDDPRDRSSISKNPLKHESQSQHESNSEENSEKHHVIDPLLSTNQFILQNSDTVMREQMILKDNQNMIFDNPSNGSDLLLQNHELDYSITNPTEEQVAGFIVDDDLKSSVKIASDLWIDQSYEIVTDHETDEHDIVPSSKFSDLSLISNHLNDRLAFGEDQLRRNDEEVAMNTHEFFDNIHGEHDEAMPEFRSNDIQTEISDDVSQLQYVQTDSLISTASIDTTMVFEEKPPSLDEVHITTPRCIQLCDPFKQTINPKSDTSFSTTTKQSILHDSPHIDIYQNEGDSLERTLPHHSYTFPSDLKNPSLSNTFLSHRRITSSDNAESQKTYDSSEPSLSMQRFDQQQKSTEKFKTLRIMTIPQKSIDDTVPENESRSVYQQKKYYLKNQFSDAQLDKLSLDRSSSTSRKHRKHRKVTKRTVVSTKCRRRQRLIRPPWVSPRTTPSPFKRSLHPTSLSFQQLRNPCQILEVYTRFKRIHCKPYVCICTPLPPCFC